MGLIESCRELAEVYNDRLVLEHEARQAHREKLLSTLVIYASLSHSSFSPDLERLTNLSTSSEASTPEEKAMIEWLLSIFNFPTNPYPIATVSVLIAGVC